jgi:PAS domain S-box-containing protein
MVEVKHTSSKVLNSGVEPPLALAQPVSLADHTLREVMASAPFAMALCCPSGVLRHVNATLARLLNASPESLIGASTERLPFLPAAAAEATVRGSWGPSEEPIGREQNVSTVARVWLRRVNAAYELLLYIQPLASACDASVKEWQENARRNEERFQLAARAVNGYFYDWNLISGLVFRSENLERLLGVSPEQTPGRIGWWLENMHPEDREGITNRLQHILGSNSTAFELEYRARHRNGEWVECWDRAYIVRDKSGRAVRVVGSCTDISERKRGEEDLLRRKNSFQTLAENSPNVIMRFDRKFRHLYVNRAIEVATGIPREQFLNKTKGELGLPEYHRRSWEERLAETFLARREIIFEFDYAGPAGLRHYQAQFVPEFAEDGSVDTVLGVATDITEQKTAERAVHEARRLAETASRSKSEFLANMSHEIRTPMTAILGYAEILATHLRDADNLMCVETIRRNGKYLLEILNDILDLSKIESGKLNVEWRRFCPAELLAEVCALMEVRAREKGLTLSVDYVDPVPDRIQSDSTRLRQILVNLIGNAIKFTDTGSVRLKVRTFPEEEKIRFDVMDTGIGMKLEDQARLFRPFTQIDSSLTRRFDGTGLGLAISSRLAEMLGGQIHVSSELSKGSTFTLEIATGSLKGAQFAIPERESEPPRARQPYHPRRLSCTVLVVDDRREVRYLAQHLIEEAGGRALFAANGREAVDRLFDRSTPPVDAVLMDMQMPVMDGYQATQLLRAAGLGCPIVAMTAHAMQGDREKCLAAGCDDYTTKPLDRESLVELLARYTQDYSAAELQSRRTQQRNARAGSRILLIDDNVDIGRTLRILLTHRGHEVHVEQAGETGIATAVRIRPDVVVVDIGLPDINGYEVARRLRTDTQLSECVLIALTGYAGDDEREKARQAGFDHHLAKPADVEDLERLFGTRTGLGENAVGS